MVPAGWMQRHPVLWQCRSLPPPCIPNVRSAGRRIMERLGGDDGERTGSALRGVPVVIGVSSGNMAVPRDNRVCVDSLKRELDTGIVMAHLAIEELGSGKSKTARRAEENARHAYSTFTRCLPRAEPHFTLSEKIEIDKKRAELERLIVSFGEDGRP